MAALVLMKAKNNKFFYSCLLLLLPLLLILSASSNSIVKTLPGYNGDLPFKLETGYVSVGEGVHLFYYFIESEGNPKKDPLVLWLTGGPGCSSFNGLVYEVGPLSFDTFHYESGFPNMTLNPYSWTQLASMIFLDAPVGTGFSYADNWEGYVIDDLLSATQTYHFLKKWLKEHPKFYSNDFYVSGDSYSGIIVPIIVEKIYEGNFEVGTEPPINIMGYTLGNPVTTLHDDLNARIEYAHRVALLSDELYESTKKNCDGEYVDVNPTNAGCVQNLTVVSECLRNIDIAHILEPNCAYASRNSTKLKGNWSRRSRILLEKNPTDLFLLPSPLPKPWCRIYNAVLSYIWANDESVREALHVRKGTVAKWVRCNQTMSYTKNVASSFSYHRNLSHTYLRALIYSGDHDMTFPYLGTHRWIESLELPVSDDWRPWFVEGQVAGYTMKYVKKFHLTFATVKGAGHTAPEYKPKECFAMIQRWYAHYSL